MLAVSSFPGYACFKHSNRFFTQKITSRATSPFHRPLPVCRQKLQAMYSEGIFLYCILIFTHQASMQ